MTRSGIWLLIALITVVATACERIGRQAGTGHPLNLRPCILFRPLELGRCGTFRVLEDPSRAIGREIDLRIVVLSARTQPAEPDPVVLLTGGPGMAATAMLPYANSVLSAVRERRDVILVDQRGTGDSNPLECNFYRVGSRLQPYFDPMFPVERVRECRKRLASRADLTRYTTPLAVDDLDRLRAALGYQRINLFGVSYGSRVALIYLRRHAAHVRRVVVQGVIPPEFPILLAAPWAGQRVLDHAFAECAADPQCSVEVPNPRRDLDVLLARLQQAPVRVRLWNWRRLSYEAVTLRRRGIEERIWSMLYNSGAARRTIYLVHQAVEGDWVPLAREALANSRARKRGRSEGMMLSVLCTEDAPRLARTDISGKKPGTVFKAPITYELVRACGDWPAGHLPREFAAPVQSQKPVLLLSGELDPATPPELAAAAARNLPNAVHLIEPGGGHASVDDCIRQVIGMFIRLPDGKNLGPTCMPHWTADSLLVR